MDDSTNHQFSYVTHEDICNCFNGDTLLAIQAPCGTQLEVPRPEMGQNGQKKYQINLKSNSGPIHVLLINKESSSSKPMVFPVPPPDDLAQPPSQPAAPVTPLKPAAAPPNPPEHDPNQGQQLPQTEVADTPSDGSAYQDNAAPAAPYSSLPEPELYPSLSGDSAQASASSSDYQSLLPLDVSCILKPNSFDIAKMEEPAGNISGDIIDELMSSDAMSAALNHSCYRIHVLPASATLTEMPGKEVNSTHFVPVCSVRPGIISAPQVDDLGAHPERDKWL
ncbi:transcription factor E2F5 isoform X2 [Cinclus cinclus]|uniref:transcription factor E2F5 isoform X2 n=1 Tax=Cinclus cinclus TaxID=127875 RepID=UPI002E0FA050